MASVSKDVTVRRARTSDVTAVRRLLDAYTRDRILLDKATVTLYEDIQEFWVAEHDHDAEVVGCGALHVMWEDLVIYKMLCTKKIICCTPKSQYLMKKSSQYLIKAVK